MMVARHEMPGKAWLKDPSRRARYDFTPLLTFRFRFKGAACPRDHTVPYGTDRLSNMFQAINCLDFGELSRVAALILSIRDRIR